MSKISCKCGNILPDNTDYISYKAQFIADQDKEDLYNTFDKDYQLIANTFSKYSGEIFQCDICGNLILLKNNERYDFKSQTLPLFV
jgi:hypothetical protein